MGEKDGKVGAALDVAKHQQRYEHHPGHNQHHEQGRLLTGLQGRENNEIFHHIRLDTEGRADLGYTIHQS